MNSLEIVMDRFSGAGSGAHGSDTATVRPHDGERRAVLRRRNEAADRGMWTAENVAAFLKVSVSWVRHRVAANKLPHHRVGGWIVRFDPAEIRAWAISRGKR